MAERECDERTNNAECGCRHAGGCCHPDGHDVDLVIFDFGLNSYYSHFAFQCSAFLFVAAYGFEQFRSRNV